MTLTEKILRKLFRSTIHNIEQRASDRFAQQLVYGKGITVWSDDTGVHELGVISSTKGGMKERVK